MCACVCMCVVCVWCVCVCYCVSVRVCVNYHDLTIYTIVTIFEQCQLMTGYCCFEGKIISTVILARVILNYQLSKVFFALFLPTSFKQNQW